MLNKFRCNHGDVAKDVRNALERDDALTAVRLVHTIKGVAGNIGARDLHLAAADLDQALRQNQTEVLPGLLDVFSEALDLVLSSITALEIQQPDRAEMRGPAQPVPKSIDRKRVLALLSELREFLEKDDTRAIRTLETLREALPPGMAETELAHLENQIGEYAFEEAQETLGKVEQAFDKPPGGGQNG